MRIPVSSRRAVALALGAFAAACATSPLGRSQLLLFPEDEVARIGAAAFATQKKETPASSDARTNAYVDCVATAVTQAVQGPKAGTDWEVVVFQSPEVNAFALPGGKIGVYSGMLSVATNQDELAAVIAHEVAHVLASHSNERISQAYAADVGAQLVSVAAGGTSAQQGQLYALLGMGTQVGVLLPFGRAQESEADLVGLDLMARAGFDPRRAPDLWRNMARRASASTTPEFLSTHPSHATRIQQLEKRLPTALPLYEQARAAGRAPKCG